MREEGRAVKEDLGLLWLLLMIDQSNFNNAFSHGGLQEEVHMTLPQISNHHGPVKGTGIKWYEKLLFLLLDCA
jgi:hypothetical protein